MFCGIDAGLRHCICIKDETGKILHKFFINNNKADYGKLKSLIDKETKICIEDTGGYSHIIYKHLKERGYDIKRINSYKSDKLRVFLNDNVKTDNKDAEFLADLRKIKDDFEYKDLNEHDELKNLSRLHRFIIKYLTKLKNKLHIEIFKLCPELKSEFKKKLSKTVLKLLYNFSPNDLNDLSVEEIHQFAHNNKFYIKRTSIEKIKNAFHDTVGITDNIVCVRSLLELYNETQRLLETMEKQISEAVNNSKYRRLTELPFINTITAGCLIGEIDNIQRFSNHNKFVKFCGLDVSSKQSGNMNTRGRLGKKGNPRIRKILYIIILTRIQSN